MRAEELLPEIKEEEFNVDMEDGKLVFVEMTPEEKEAYQREMSDDSFFED